MDETFGIRQKLSLAIGAKVMLQRNMDVSVGLINGLIGTVTDIEHDQLNPGRLPKAVLVKFDDDKIAKNYSNTKGDSVRIIPITVTFQDEENTLFSRCMVPLILSWGILVQKSQGTHYLKKIMHTDF